MIDDPVRAADDRVDAAGIAAGAIAAVGVDVSSRALHVVGLYADGAVVQASRFEANDRTWILSLPAATPVAIDGPAGPSAAPFATDSNLAPKFRTARGCEVELGRQHGFWVSFATPQSPDDLPPWMRVAGSVFDDLHDAGHVPLETWPYANYAAMFGRRPPKKSTVEGRDTRRALLRANGVADPSGLLAGNGHDMLDAAAAALVALHHRQGCAVPVRCPLDETVIWLVATPRPTGHGDLP